ncbi:GntR family transcriptional regulator YhfZ [Sutcliffiella rhizosphaerae]|uniref:GntR family transcriptional regulator YhfZ n=1 Tax=Sutcliffiella rhizosphaerae TaxID=2880967 RepID=UPI001E2A2BD0|nr:GntR family transcriptional regulator YhfZ [Sutcliffiella rhizosphaerae]
MNILKNDYGLYSKRGLILQKLAEKLLFVEVNERIPKIEDLSIDLQVGRGTIQTSLQRLVELKAISLESRGHLGTYLRSKNHHELLKSAGMNQITAVMPLPYSKKYEGIATGLTIAFEELHIFFNIAFMRGSSLRIQALQDGRYDLALVSKYSANEHMREDKDLAIGLSFGEHSYVSGHALMFADDTHTTIENGMKIGVDPSSTDQRTLIVAETTGKNVELVELNYMHLLSNLHAGKIDATVWNMDEKSSGEVNNRPLTTANGTMLEGEMSEAVCLMRKDNEKLAYILQLLSVEAILSIQKQVEENELIPRY